MTAPAPAWWHQPGTLQRFVCDLVAGELVRLRPGYRRRGGAWDANLRFAEDLGADSLERLQLATAVADATHLHSSGVEDTLLAAETIGDWTQTLARGLESFSAELTFRTSGSTGQPKWCLHRLADLADEVELLAALVGRGGRLLSAVPSHHIYGFLFTILLPARLGCEVIDVRANVPAGLAGTLAPGDILVGFPEFWRAFVRTTVRVAPGVTGVTSTGPCPPDVARGVAECGLRLVDVYGSSETAGIGWRDDPAAPYRLLDHWRRGASDRELVRRSPDGAERPFTVPDWLEWEGQRLVRPAGRTEGAVVVGGTNVFPARIAGLLATHPEVAQAAVRLMRADEGNRLKAFVVPRDPNADPTALRANLWAWIDTQLTTPERPKSIVFGAALPVGALGKPADWPVAVTPAAADPPDGI